MATGTADETRRIISKVGTGIATIPVSADHRNGDWLETDIYDGEFYMDDATGNVYTSNGGVIIPMLGMMQNLTSVLGVGNSTGANDIEVGAFQQIQTANSTSANKYAVRFNSAGPQDWITIERNAFGEGGKLSLTPTESSLSLESSTRDFKIQVGADDKFSFLDQTDIPTLSFNSGASLNQGNLTHDNLTADRSWSVIDADGKIPVSSVAGFTGTGSYTSFTIENGIIIAAS